ncbi:MULTISPECIES: CPCC family cysteine-rich protein [unclassified Fusibacter]|uniref:CPCC family cysteine-rich protein n=1 Tax=unclassified Fusibacter TaxID=2624464 RepID=UPI001010C3F2|nr:MULTISPECIES: CPCC family cysteine-rich protein [unclassified Fusibacter]MCK8061137.1 hypothetical protein [Fusibacter sp. A2]NPE23327.1 hypothetical protein [Fusibacter sp. A1]RXV59369.1 hypothetical protein DWB64_16020 [Fusibacter sp. A1]
MRKDWFEWYVNELGKAKKWVKFRARYLCPCCFMPTLDERASYDICPICFWEDDGQDSDDADVVRYGPNSDYSLTEARINFNKLFTMYRKTEANIDLLALLRKRETGRRTLYEALQNAIESNSDDDWSIAMDIEVRYRELDFDS